MADRPEIERLWDTVERLRNRWHDLNTRVTALEWREKQQERERRYIIGLPAKIAASIVTVAAVYSALHILFGHFIR